MASPADRERDVVRNSESDSSGNLLGSRRFDYSALIFRLVVVMMGHDGREAYCILDASSAPSLKAFLITSIPGQKNLTLFDVLPKLFKIIHCG